MNFASETADFIAAIPPTHEFHIGIYFSAYSKCPPPSAAYNRDVLALALGTGRVDGVTVYVTEHITTDCTDLLADKGCVVQQGFRNATLW